MSADCLVAQQGRSGRAVLPLDRQTGQSSRSTFAISPGSRSSQPPEGTAGAYNVTAPEGRETFGGLLGRAPM
jgi:hypothetical protein